MSDIIVESVAPADIYIRLLIPFKRLDQVLEVLDKAKIEFDGEEEGEAFKDAVKFVKEDFFPSMDKLVTEIRHQYGS